MEMEMDDTKFNLAVRKKRWSRRARTGCQTCRYVLFNPMVRRLTEDVSDRRVKCDEAKPTCYRCIISRRRCGGIGYGFVAARMWLPLLPQPDSAVSQLPSGQSTSPRDRSMFYIFRQDVLPYMLDVFDADFWAVMIPQASQVYPSVWHGAMATAAVRSLLLAKKKTGGELYRYALFHCNMAIQQIIAIDPATATPADQEMVLLTCVLLICYAMFCSNHYEAFTHIHNGLYLSKLWQPRTRQQGCVSDGTSVGLRFRRLESMTICAPSRLAEPASSRYNLDLLISLDVPFESTTEAYLELLLVDVEWKRSMRLDGLPTRETTLRFLVPECELLRVPFRIWQKKYHAFRAWQKNRHHLGDQRHTNDAVEAVRRSGVELLELTLEALTCVDITAGEVAWDEYTSNFDRIVKLSSHMLDEQGEALLAKSSKTTLLPRNSQFHSLLALPTVAVGILCRQPDLRRRGLALLRTVPYLAGLFDMAYFVGIIEAQMRIEEQGLLLDPIEGGCDCVLGRYICAAHRMSEAVISPGSAQLRTGHDLMHGRTGITVSLTGTCTSWLEECDGRKKQLIIA